MPRLGPTVLAAGLVALSALVTSVGHAAHVVRVTAEHASVEPGGRFEARIELDRQYDNPFDPNAIQVDALVVTPSGTVHRIPAYWDRDTTRELAGGREVLTAVGEGSFRVRYAPLETGSHEVTIVARDADGEDVSAATVFDAQSAGAPGFVHVDPSDPLALARDDGTPYVPFGANVCWSTEPSAGYDMEAYLQSLAEAGGNWSRLWMTHFGEGWTLEWNADHPSGYYAGLGRYSVEVAGRLDRVFELAESKGIGIQLVLWQHSQFETENWSSWGENPYNASNGGPAATSREFFEGQASIELSQRRIRYLVGRYAAYRSLLAWEVMNEMDGVNAPAQSVARWSEDRARELRAADPYAHLVTTSHLVRPYLTPLVAYESDAYDLSQAHAYGGSFAFAIPKDAQALRAMGKPAVFGEFGLDYLGVVEAQDPHGIHLAEGAWIALASGFWGGAMSWWWDTYLRPNELWETQRGIANFTRAVDLRGMHQPLAEEASAEDPGGRELDVFGRRGDSGAMLYVRHPDARWEIAATAGLPQVEGGRVRVPCVAGSQCSGQAFDTFTGVAVGETIGVTGEADGAAWFSLPSFRGSIAVVVRPGTGSAMPVLGAAGGCSATPYTGPRSPRGWLAALGALLCAGMAKRRRLPRGYSPSSSTP